MRRYLIPTLCVSLLVPAAAYAAGGHGFHFKEHGYYIINFVVLMGALYYFLKKPLSKYLSDRHDVIAQEVETSRKLRDEAQAKLKIANERLSQLAGELEKIKKHFAEEGEKARQQIIEDAHRTAEKIKRNATLLINQEIDKARHQVRQEIVRKTMAITEVKLTSELSENVRRKLVADFIESMKEMPGLKQIGGGQ